MEIGKDGLIHSLEDLKFSEYPYTYTRVVAMRSKLFKNQDYDKILKMSNNQILKHLQDNGYADEINKLALEYSGIELIERAINQNLAGNFSKLTKICDGALKELVIIYLTKFDIENIKTILRGKDSGVSNKKIENTFIPVGSISSEKFKSYLLKSDVEETLKCMDFLSKSAFKTILTYYQKDSNLVRIENYLDRAYYRTLFLLSDKIPKQGKVFKEYLTKHLQLYNILTLIRLKKIGVPEDRIKNNMILISSDVKFARTSYIKRLIGLKYENMLLELHKSYFGKYIAAGMDYYEKTGSILMIEVGLQKALFDLTIKLQHQNPVTLDVILGYMFAKEIEVRNLSIIIKGRRLNVDEDFIKKQLIIGGLR
ncbi:V-type ATPase subunit [Candidatus Woesearchaeota archaeon]|nr:V-type ATPase subunit [Candidatus Woesearchaeota archaeon]